MAVVLPDGPWDGGRQDVGSRGPLLSIGPRLIPVAPARPTVLTAAERKRLKTMAYGQKTEHRLRMRAQIVLHAARGRSNTRIVCETGRHLDTMRRWRGRFAEHGLGGLSDRKRSGRPPVFTPLQVAEVKALACRLPAETGTPLSRWSCPELAREVAARAITGPVSASIVRRRLDDDAPHHGPVRPRLERRPAGRGRVRDLRGREDLHPGPLPRALVASELLSHSKGVSTGPKSPGVLAGSRRIRGCIDQRAVAR
ncbi:helix-turn-helix domain-containing protein [Streptomyces sp. NPDC004270]